MFVLFDILCRQGLGHYHPSIAKDVWITYCYTNFKICSSMSEQQTNYSEHACACMMLREKVYKIWIRQTAPFLYRLCSFRARMTYDKGFKMFYPNNDTSDVAMSNTVHVANIFKASLYNNTLDKFYKEKNMDDFLNTEAFMGHNIGQRCYGPDIILVFTGVWLLLENLRVI
ncbi:unnamed protein product [Lymnaea stagnalis]|uniref:Uncharacterized protein n=1 Tax=Lymnaea stagnalis TaxID=6523 RepID=A0AAV2I6U2_LYMST